MPTVAAYTQSILMKHYAAEDRYQFQPWHIRLARRARHQPVAVAVLCWRLLKWVVTGMPKAYTENADGSVHEVFGRGFTLRMILTGARAEWTMRAGWWFTTDEAMGELRRHS